MEDKHEESFADYSREMSAEATDAAELRNSHGGRDEVTTGYAGRCASCGKPVRWVEACFCMDDLDAEQEADEIDDMPIHGPEE